MTRPASGSETALPERAVADAALAHEDRGGDRDGVTRAGPPDGHEERSAVDAVLRAGLDEEVGAPNELADARAAGLRGEPRELITKRAEEPAEARDAALELLRLEALQAARRGFGRVRDLCRDADVAGVQLAAAADRAPERDHRERREADAVRAETHHLHDVERALHPAVAPDLDPRAEPVLRERAVRLRDPDLGGQARPPQGVQPRGAGSAVVAGQRDDVRARLRDTAGDDPDVRGDRDLHRDLRARIDRLQLVHDLREVLDRGYLVG